jgi:hypothetical protein
MTGRSAIKQQGDGHNNGFLCRFWPRKFSLGVKTTIIAKLLANLTAVKKSCAN